MTLKKRRQTRACELLLHYLMNLKGYLELLEERKGIIEESIAQSAEIELTAALTDINRLRTDSLLNGSRDAIGDAYYLTLDLLEKGLRREALMETFEGVRDAALQEEGVNQIEVRVADKKKLQEAIDYYYRAKVVIAHPANLLGVAAGRVEDDSAFIL